MQHSADLRRCLAEGDAETAMRLWRAERPHAAQPENAYQATMMLHYARTRLASIPQWLRFYSHRWLTDNGFPSALPDHLKPKAERMYPVTAAAVGVSSQAWPGAKTPFNVAVERVMSDAVLEAYADGHANQPAIVKARILQRRADFKRRA